MEKGDDKSIPELIRTHGVTHIITVPSFIQMVAMLPGGTDALTILRRIVVGGETLSPRLLQDLGPSISERIINAYGPTETTVISTVWEAIYEASSIPIGRPIANTMIFVLDAYRRPVPVGVVGELYIGGAGVARGYLNRKDLTDQKFIANPFGDSPSKRLYRTGDLVRYRTDGTLEFVGRIDDQIKILGYRVELGEIEAVISRHPNLRESVVDVQKSEEIGNRIVAYVVPGPSGLPPVKELRQWARRKLPGYMVPAVFVTLNEIPRTSNGKLDRNALPPPIKSNAPSDEEERPLSLLEAKLTEVWCEVLGLKHVSVDENFFDLGGNSLLMARILIKLKNIIPQEIPIVLLFQYPTIGSLSNYLSNEVTARSSFKRIYDRAEMHKRAIIRQKQRQKRLDVNNE
jgi:acyl-coenzyme A synthetase/AMP-(fatty) acid ligase/acyl carrier protein